MIMITIALYIYIALLEFNLVGRPWEFGVVFGMRVEHQAVPDAMICVLLQIT